MLLQGPLWKPLELNLVRSHVQGGIGHYHLFLLQLQLDYKLDLRGVVDFPMLISEDKLKKGKGSVCIIILIFENVHIFLYYFTCLQFYKRFENFSEFLPLAYVFWRRKQISNLKTALNAYHFLFESHSLDIWTVKLGWFLISPSLSIEIKS